MSPKKKYPNKIIFLIIILGLMIVGYFGLNFFSKNSAQKTVDEDINIAQFVCDDNKSITATFYLQNDTQVDLKLSDGRKLSLPHAISASGARYANQDESVVFWNKGNTAFIEENGQTTFHDCVTNTN